MNITSLYPKILSLALSMAVFPLAQAQNDPVQVGPNIATVHTQAGNVQGYLQNGVYTYLGIPYAKAERFMPPTAVEKWQGVRLAVTPGAICPQISMGMDGSYFFSGPKLTESEDCQNLNIWTPNINDGKKRAVMVWLHGGGFQSGSSLELDAYDGANLSRTGDVVVVSINHRLNLMGYLDLSAYGDKYKYSANLGILDLVSALEWVQKNIAQFGGDPENVTLFGESGGGAKVLTLMATPKAQGLFHKAIVQSGAVERMGMTLTSPKAGQRVSELTLAALNLSPKEVDKLKTLPYAELVGATQQALQQTAQEQKLEAVLGTGYDLSWAPTMDGDYIPSEPVGEKYPEIAKNIPLLIGSNMTEWTTIPLLFDLAKNQADNRNTWTEAEVKQRLQKQYGAQTEAIIKAFQQAYPERKLADALYVDSFLRTPAIKTANLKAAQQGAPVYQYLFTWDTPVFNGLPMSYHTSEIPFVFNNIDRVQKTTGGGKEAQELAQKISSAWVNFAKTGNPNGKGLPQWDAYTQENGNTMIFDTKLSVKQHHDRALLKLLAPDYNF